MAKKATKNSKKKAADQTKTPAATKAAPAVAPSVRSEAAKRTAAGTFTKIIFNQIGGRECPRFAPMTWKERDAFLAKPENTVVLERYEAHMKSVLK